MKALVKTKLGRGNVELLDVPRPDVRAGFVLIEVKAAGLCGTDVHILNGDFKVEPPVILGHEVSGVIAEVGKGVSRIAVGDRVTTEAYFKTCGLCRYCRSGHENLCLERISIGSGANGGLAGYVLVPAKNIHPLPPNIDFVQGCITEPLACVIHSTCDLATIAPGDVVVISGPGPIGLLVLQVVKQAGCVAVVIGTGKDGDRLRMARELGADWAVSIEDEDIAGIIGRLSGGFGADVVFECAGVEASAGMCLRLVRKGGQFIQVGLMGNPVTFDLNQAVLKEVAIQGSFASVPSAWQRALRLMELDKVKTKPLISHVLPLSDWQKAFDLFREKSGLKIVLTPID